MQSKKFSLFESITNTAIGYIISFLSQLLIFPVFNISVSIKTNLMIGVWFTVISIIRSYLLRRFFNFVDYRRR